MNENEWRHMQRKAFEGICNVCDSDLHTTDDHDIEWEDYTAISPEVLSEQAKDLRADIAECWDNLLRDGGVNAYIKARYHAEGMDYEGEDGGPR